MHDPQSPPVLELSGLTPAHEHLHHQVLFSPSLDVPAAAGLYQLLRGDIDRKQLGKQLGGTKLALIEHLAEQAGASLPT